MARRFRIDVRRAYTRKEALARLLAIRQALDIILLNVARGPERPYSGADLAASLRNVTRSP